jgi:ABC-type hemin transport system ATPase subunit
VLLHRGKALACGPPLEVYQREILEPVFDAPLDVEIAPSGRPRVMLREVSGGSWGPRN